MRKLILLFISVIGIVSAQENLQCLHYDESGRTREHNIDMISMNLAISFDVMEKKVFGEIEYVFAPIRPKIDSIILDAPDITINTIQSKDVASFRSTEEHLIIYFTQSPTWNDTLALTINYEAQPEKGIYFLGWEDETNRARKQIWTQGQGIDNRYWIPSFDDVSDKLITELHITFDKQYEVISNGNLIATTSKNDSEQTWHYKMDDPHVNYLVMIAIGEYDYVDYVSSSGIVNRQYYYPENPEKAAVTYRYSAEMMDWMEEKFDVPYPWGKIYRNVPVADFLYGAMENTTSTIFTDYYLQNSREALERDYIGTNAHELTHQWFGDLITEWSGTHHWLHESFATYYAKQFKRHVSSEDDYQWARYWEMQSAFRADDKNDLPVAHSKAGSSRHYPKGSIVIDMLADAAGGYEAFDKVMHNFIKKYAFKHVDTHLFELEFMETLGLNLDWFFDQWIYKGGYPIFKVDYSTENNKLILTVEQTQEWNETIGLFKCKIPIEIYLKNGEIMQESIWMDTIMQSFEFSIDNSEIVTVVFNANNTIYAKIDFEKATDEWLFQANNAMHGIDQFLAVKALEDVAVQEKRADFARLFDKTTFYPVQSSIVKQIVNDKHEKSISIIQKALKSDEKNVRYACVSFTDSIPTYLVNDYLPLLNDSSFSLIQASLAQLCKDYPERTIEFTELVKDDTAINDFVNIAYLYERIKVGEEELLPQLIDYASESFEFRRRIKAMDKLGELNCQDELYIHHLIQASTQFNRRLAGVAKKYLKPMLEDETLKTIIKENKQLNSLDKNEQKRWDKLVD